jgi:hypothetical protein
MTSNRQCDSRARRGSLTEVIHGESEGVPHAAKKLGEQPALFDHANWIAGEHGEPFSIVPDTPNPSLEAMPAVTQSLVEAETLDAMRQGIEFDGPGWAPRRVRSRRKT